MGKLWYVPLSGTLENADGNTDLIEITPADDLPIRLHAILLGQSSEVQEAQEESLRISVKRLPATVTSGSGGTTPERSDPKTQGVNPSFTVEGFNDVVATTSGTAEDLDNFSWNVRGTPYWHVYPDERFMPEARGAEVLVVRLESTVADQITFEGGVWIEEL